MESVSCKEVNFREHNFAREDHMDGRSNFRLLLQCFRNDVQYNQENAVVLEGQTGPEQDVILLSWVRDTVGC